MAGGGGSAAAGWGRLGASAAAPRAGPVRVAGVCPFLPAANGAQTRW